MTRWRWAGAALLVGVAWLVAERDGIELVSWLAGIGAFLLAAETAAAVRVQRADAQDAAAGRPVSGDEVGEPVVSGFEVESQPGIEPPALHPAETGPVNPAPADSVIPEPVVAEPVVARSCAAGPEQVSRVKKTMDAAIGLVSVVSLIALIVWISIYDGPRSTQEVRCTMGICTVG